MSILNLVYQYPWVSYVVGALQMICIIHAVLRRNYFWIFLLLFVPLLGVIIYFFAEVLPGIRRPRVSLDPLREGLKSNATRLREAREALAEGDTLTRRLALAALLKDAGDYAEARATLEPAVNGLYHEDPALLTELADLALRQQEPQQALDWLAHIDVRRSAAVRVRTLLLRAEAHALLKEDEAAERDFRDALQGATSEEPRVKYAQFLLQRGRTEEATVLLDALRKTWQRANGLYRRQERPWFDLAERLRRQTGTAARP